MSSKLIIAGVNYSEHELGSILSLLEPEQIENTEILPSSTIDDIWLCWNRHQLIVIIFLRLYPNNIADNCYYKLQHITQYRNKEHLPLLIVANGLESIDFAYDLGATGFLVSPPERLRLHGFFAIAKEKALSRREELLIYKKENFCCALPFSKILWVKTSQQCAEIQCCCHSKPFTCGLSMPIDDLQNRLFNVSPGLLINMEHVYEVHSCFIVLADQEKTKFPISKDRLEEAQAAFMSISK